MEHGAIEDANHFAHVVLVQHLLRVLQLTYLFIYNHHHDLHVLEGNGSGETQNIMAQIASDYR